MRAASDAILVGAQTVRQDNPRLLVRSERGRDERVSRGLPPTPTKVTVTDGARLDPTGEVLLHGRDRQARVLRPAGRTRGPRAAGRRRDRRRRRPAGADAALVEDLHDRGTRRLMVEGGGSIHTQFLTAGLADELHLVVAPFFVGDSRAPRFVEDGRFPWNQDRRATLADVRRLGDVVLLRYALSDRYEDG